MPSFTEFQQQARIVNRMITMQASHSLSLTALLPKLPNARYNRARPCRIYWRYKDLVPVQIFPKGMVQILGGRASRKVCERIRDFLMTHCDMTLSQPHLSSCTVSYQLPSRLSSLTSLPSNHRISNDYEIFPGTLIHHPQRHHRFHLCFFPNGTAIITGVRSLREAYEQLQDCLSRYPIVE